MKNKFFYWLTRVLGIILVILFLLLSFDVFEMEGTFLEKLGGFLMHNISTMVLALFLALAWKKEKIGGWALIVVSLAIFFLFGVFSFFLLSPAVVGLLFLIDYYLKKNEQ